MSLSLVMAKNKRKASPPRPRKRIMMDPNEISPTSKIQVFKLDVVSCNGQAISQSTELGASDLEDIWKRTLGRTLDEIKGYTSSKGKNKEIRI